VWNLALEQAGYWRRGRGSTPGHAERNRQLTEARAGSWLGEGSSSVQQQALRDFDQAMRNWWSGTHRRPTWRKQGLHEGFAIRDLSVVKIAKRWATIHVPKVGPVRFRLSRPLPQATKSARVTLDRCGRWHVSFTAIPPEVAGPGDGTIVGVDRGVVIPFQVSDGRAFDVPGLRPAEQVRLLRLQRRLARQQKGSNRRTRTRHAIARMKAKETDRRKDAIEKATTELARTVDVVRIEDLRIRQMAKSAAGTIEKPGVNVAQKRGLNRGIMSKGWGLFEQRLGHKIGDRLERVPAAYTSTTCSACGNREASQRESQARFVCRFCELAENADVNAARNIAAGHAVSGRGGNRAIRRPSEASTVLVGAA
jgi:transposase